MQSNTNKPFKISAILLALALIFPFTTEALHIINHHNHEHCTENSSTHFHKHEYECDIFDFHLSTIVSLNDDYLAPPITLNFKTIFPPNEESHLENLSLHIKLRGPPYFT